jgi:hypothetical protein
MTQNIVHCEIAGERNYKELSLELLHERITV